MNGPGMNATFFGVLNLHVDFLAVDRHVSRTVDPQLHLPFAYLQHAHLDFVGNPNRLSLFSA